MAEWVMLWILCALSHLCSVSRGRPAMSSDSTVYSNATILCPNISSEHKEKTYKLLRGGQMLHLVRYKSGEYENATKVLHNNEQSELRADADGHVNFLLSHLTSNSSGLYTCHVCLDFPPPSVCRSNSAELVVVETRSVAVEASGPIQTDCGHHPSHTLFLVALGLVSLYGLLLTPFTFRLWRKVKKSQTNDHDYINMRLPFGRRRYNGVQHPAYPPKH